MYELEIVTLEIAQTVCKIGQGAACCRYLTMGLRGWSCEKLNPPMRALFDRRVAQMLMTARGDNCDGKASR